MGTDSSYNINNVVWGKSREKSQTNNFRNNSNNACLGKSRKLPNKNNSLKNNSYNACLGKNLKCPNK